MITKNVLFCDIEPNLGAILKKCEQAAGKEVFNASLTEAIEITSESPYCNCGILFIDLSYELVAELLHVLSERGITNITNNQISNE